MIVYETEGFVRSAARLNIDTKRIVEKLARHDLPSIRRLPRRHGLQLFEVAANRVLVGDVVDSAVGPVFCPLEVIERDTGRETQVLGAQTRSAQELLEQLPSASEVDAFIESLEVGSAAAKPMLPDDLWQLVAPPSLSELAHQVEGDVATSTDSWDVTEAIVYESRAWTAARADPNFLLFLERLATVVFAAATTEPGARLRNQGVELYDANGITVGYRWVSMASRSRPVFFLLGMRESAEVRDSDLVDWARDVPPLTEFADDLVPTVEGHDVLARYARRAYPGFVLADEVLWKKLQRSSSGDTSTLALSAEELTLLDAIGSARADEAAGLPLFINGRAGSGKSTMLAYLFAAYWHRFLRHEPQVHLRYLTLNDRLLTPARDTVLALLQNEYGMANVLEQNERETVESSFVNFRTFLLGLLGPDERVRFDSSLREIRFAEFARLYLGEPAVRGSDDPRSRIGPFRGNIRETVTPETAWYAIRTLIKGYGEQVIAPGGYDTIPAKDRVLTEATFEAVVVQVWEGWYRSICTDQGFWDDQDLARAALDAVGVNRPSSQRSDIAVLFCDEAQDFTRLELKVLLRCSLLSKFDLGWSGGLALPFAFAGDPLQTVNPTGFRWERMQEAFHHEIVAQLDLQDRVRLSLQEFSTNYRSERRVVEFLNAINYWRLALFGITELKPQLPWRNEGGTTPPWKFVIGVNASEDSVRENLGGHPVVILPCNEGEKIAFIQDDPVLSQVFSSVSKDSPPQNVLTASEAKGLEFPLVVLYMFGAAAPEELWDDDGHGEPAGDPLVREFFFNKLYVAASRAQDRLVVIDTRAGDERLWSHFPKDFGEVVADDPRLATWGSQSLGLEMAIDTGLAELRDGVDFLHLGEEFYDQGLLIRSPALLRLAAQNFRSAGELTRAETAQGWALVHEGSYSEGGAVLSGLGRWRDAWDAYWRGEQWDAMARWFQEAPVNLHAGMERERTLVDFLTAPDDSMDALAAFVDALIRSLGEMNVSLSYQAHWQTAVAELRAQLEAGVDRLSDVHVSSAVEVLEKLGECMFPGTFSVAGQLAFDRGEWSTAVRMWERADTSPSTSLAIARARSAGFPQGLIWLERSNLHSQMVEAWDDHGRPMDERWLRHLAPPLRRTQRFLDAAEGFRLTARYGDARVCLSEWIRSQPQIRRLPKETRRRASEAMVELADAVAGEADLGLLDEILSMLRFEPWPQVDDQLTADVRRAAVEGLALTPTLDEAAARQLWDLVGRRGQRRSRPVEPLLMAIAYERSSPNIVEALKRYEELFSDDDPQVARWARERWLANKTRHVAHTQDQIDRLERDRSSLRLIDPGRARRESELTHDRAYQERQLREREAEWRLQADEVPSVESFVRNVASRRAERSRARLIEPTRPWRWEGENLEAEFYPERGRVRLTDLESGNGWMIDLQGRTIAGAALGASWHELRPGGARVRLVDSSDAGVVVEVQEPGSSPIASHPLRLGEDGY